MKANEKSRAFLTEFIIVILFFSIAAVIVVNIFVKANEKSKESYELTHITYLLENMEEAISNCSYNYDNPLDVQDSELKNVLESFGFVNENGIYISYYNSSYVKCIKEDAKYVVNIEMALDESKNYSKILSFSIKTSKASNALEVYSISFNKLLMTGEN